MCLGTCAALSVTVQWGNAEMYRRSGLIISQEQGLRYYICWPLALACSASADVMMGLVYGALLVAVLVAQ